MIAVKFLLSLFFWTYIQIGILIELLFALPAWLLPKKGRAFNYFITRLLLKLLFFICFFRVKISGLENLPKDGRLIFIANKPDLVSTFALIAAFPLRLRFVAEENVFMMPLLGWLVRSIGCIAAGKYKEGPFKFAAAVLSALRHQEAVLMYPRNLRRRDDRISEFKEAELKLAKLAEAALVPIIIKGTNRIITRGSMVISPGRIEVMITRPLKSPELENLGIITQQLEALYREQLAGGQA